MKTNMLPPRAVLARRVYVATVAGHAAAHGAIGAVYSLSLIAKGLSTEYLMYVNAFFYLGISLLEVPTGAYADIRGRKESCCVGWSVMVLGFLMYAYASNFLGCVCAEMLFALGMTLISGANRAWLSDEYTACGMQADFRSQTTSIANTIAVTVSSLTALVSVELLRAHGPSAPFITGFACILATAIVGWTYMRRDTPTKRFDEVHPLTTYRNTITNGWRLYRESTSLRRLLSIMCFYNLTFMAPNMFWQILYKDILPAGRGVGLAWICIKASLFIGSMWAIRSSRGTWLPLVRCQMLTGCTLTASGVIALLSDSTPLLLISLLFFSMHEVGRGWFEPVRADFVDRAIDETGRTDHGAMLRSIDSIVSHTGGLVGLVLFGYLQQHIDPATSVVVSGSILIINAVVGLFRSR
jgi:MFS family permease